MPWRCRTASTVRAASPRSAAPAGARRRSRSTMPGRSARSDRPLESPRATSSHRRRRTRPSARARPRKPGRTTPRQGCRPPSPTTREAPARASLDRADLRGGARPALGSSRGSRSRPPRVEGFRTPRSPCRAAISASSEPSWPPMPVMRARPSAIGRGYSRVRLTKGILVDALDRLGCSRRRELALGCAAAVRAEPCAPSGISEEVRDRPAQPRYVAGGHQNGACAQVGQPADTGRDDRPPVRHRLARHQPVALAPRRDADDGRALVERAELATAARSRAPPGRGRAAARRRRSRAAAPPSPRRTRGCLSPR